MKKLDDSQEKNFSCTICEKSFTSIVNLQQHVKEHQKLINEKSRKKCYKCHLCGQQFDTAIKVKHHLKLHTEIREHKCFICHKSFSQREKLKVHLKSHKLQEKQKTITDEVQIKPEIDENDSNENVDQNENGEQKTNGASKIIYVCRLCSYESLTLSDMRQHLQTHNVQILTIFSHLKYKCAECSSLHETIYDVFQHNNIHASNNTTNFTVVNRRYKCISCDKTFSNMSRLRTHAKTHETKWPRQCTYCDDMISKRGDMFLHMNAKHDNMKKYVCTLCGKKFFQEKHLTSHLQIHTGEKKYMCDVCGWSFQAQNNLVSEEIFYVS